MINFNIHKSKFIKITLLSIIVSIANSCIDVNYQLGKNLQATNEQYDIYETTIPLDNLNMEIPEGLATYSSLKFAVGAIKVGNKVDSRSTCFTLVPYTDSINFGKPGTQVFKRFHFQAPLEYTSYNSDDQKYILQNFYVYELNKAINPQVAQPTIDANTSKTISLGNIVYNGTDSLSFDFSKEFGQKYLNIKKEDLKSIEAYTKKFPGIYIKTIDDPAVLKEGGRINAFKLFIDVQNYNITGGFATLSFSAEYEGRGVVDTSILFLLGPAKIYNLKGKQHTNETLNPQYAYNHCNFIDNSPERGNLFLEGGNGYKPVFKGEQLYQKIKEKIHEIIPDRNLNEVTINKATISIPYIFPKNYTEMYKYPVVISPHRKFIKNDTIVYLPITDSKVTSLSKGEINTSKLEYTPDISFYTQRLIDKKEADDFSRYDLWMLPMRSELVSSAKTLSEEEKAQQEQYKELLKANIAYSMYNDSYYPGSYGGYGYGGYGYYNQNYYNLAALQQIENEQNKPQERYNILMPDYITYYNAQLVSTRSAGEATNNSISTTTLPKLKIIFSVPKK